MRLNPHLTFDGRCEEAFRFYREVIGGEILAMVRYQGTPLAHRVPPAWREKILHATLDLGGTRLTGADVTAEEGYVAPTGFSVLVEAGTAAEAERVFAALSDGGDVILPLTPTFWAERFGMLVDRFRIPWILNCARPGAEADG
ncbi:MAG TPA: VOC family protein [Myxococcaceae bacterium]|nr:VOC family protein [Myxococcaceae bacterium]